MPLYFHGPGTGGGGGSAWTDVATNTARAARVEARRNARRMETPGSGTLDGAGARAALARVGGDQLLALGAGLRRRPGRRGLRLEQRLRDEEHDERNDDEVHE